MTINELAHRDHTSNSPSLELFELVKRICPETALEAPIPEKPSVGTHEPKSGSEVPPKAKMEEIYRDSWKTT